MKKTKECPSYILNLRVGDYDIIDINLLSTRKKITLIAAGFASVKSKIADVKQYYSAINCMCHVFNWAIDNQNVDATINEQRICIYK